MGEREHTPADEAQAERGLALIEAAVAQTRAPLGLRERIQSDRERARPARRTWTLGGSLIGAIGALALAIVLATGGGTAAPTVAQAAQFAKLAPAAAAPPVDQSEPGLLKRSVGGVQYPSWKGEFPWKASGVRTDTIKGRNAVTVFYDNPAGERIGYTIVDGKALDEPSGQRTLDQGSEHYVVLRGGDRTVVTWRRGGHTCILSGPSNIASDKLLALASWSGNGPV
jgi:hypothetical protein